MGRLAVYAAAACFSLLVGATTLDGGNVLKMRVSPVVSMAPGFVTVRVNVEPSTENRLLEVTTESADYYRRSEVPLDGADAPTLNVFEFRDLPTGLYEVTSVVVGTHGPRMTATTLAKVASSPGTR